MATSEALAPVKKSRCKLSQQSHRQADDVGDAALDPLHQGRPQRLNRVSATSAPPLPKPHIPLFLGLRELLEVHQGAFQPRPSSPPSRITSPLSTSWARPDIRSNTPSLNLAFRLAKRFAIEHHVRVAGDHQHIPNRPDRVRLHPSVLDDLELRVPTRQLVYAWSDDLKLHAQLLKDLPPLRTGGGSPAFEESAFLKLQTRSEPGVRSVGGASCTFSPLRKANAAGDPRKS